MPTGLETGESPVDGKQPLDVVGGWTRFSPLRLTFGFFTILPLAGSGPLKEIAAAVYLLPAVAVFLGGAEGIVGWASLQLLGPPVAAALALGAALVLTGFHHADGLADVGDAIMARGDAARRIEVLRDQTMGIGAVGALLLTCLVTWTALAQLFYVRGGAMLVWSLVAAEVAARLGLITAAGLGKSSHKGSGSVFIAALKGWRGVAGAAVSVGLLAALAIPLGPAAPAAAGLAAVAITLLLIVVCGRAFGGIGGDVLGASVELGRAGALVGLVAAFNAWPAG